MTELTRLYVVFNQPSGTIAHACEEEPMLRSLAPSQTFVRYVAESAAAEERYAVLASAWQQGYDSGFSYHTARNPYLK